MMRFTTRVWNKMEGLRRFSATAELLHRKRNITYCIGLTSSLSRRSHRSQFSFHSSPRQSDWRNRHGRTGSCERLRFVSLKARTSARWSVNVRGGDAPRQEVQDWGIVCWLITAPHPYTTPHLTPGKFCRPDAREAGSWSSQLFPTSFLMILLDNAHVSVS